MALLKLWGLIWLAMVAMIVVLATVNHWDEQDAERTPSRVHAASNQA